VRARTWRRYGPPFDQGNLGSCTGNAIAGCVNTVPFHKTGARLLTEQDAVGLYELATRLDSIPGSYPPEDTGSSGLAACKAAKQKGLISSYAHAFGIDHALGALQLGPVITGVPWYEGFDQPDATGMVSIAGEIRGGHEFEVHAIRRVGEALADTILEAVNSWGTSWAVYGKFRFSALTWAELLSQSGDVTVPTA
jgi:hypothetical protein